MALDLPTPRHPPSSGAPAAQVRAYRRWKAGQELARKDQWAGAAEAFAQASQWQADGAYGVAAVHALIRSDRSEQAIALARALHQTHPELLVAYTLESHALLSMGLNEEAVACLQSVPPSVPRDHDAWVSMAVALERCGRCEAAIQAYMQALIQKMDQPMTHYRMGMSFKELGMKAEAAECVRTALALGLGSSEVAARAQLAFLEREALRWRQADLALSELRAAIQKVPDGVALEAGAFTHAVLVDDPLEQLKVAAHYASHLQHSVRPLPKVYAKRREGRIRLGYVSSDFHQHATSQLLVQVLEAHDRERFEVTLFSSGRDDGSAMRRRVMAASEHFEDMRGNSFERIAQRVREQQIDILIDLKGATHDTTLPVFACRPAPLQVSWLGFPGTTGASYLDYLIGDRVVTPLEHAHHFKERIAQMPHCYQPNDGLRVRPQGSRRSEWGVPEDALLLCGFHQAYKITPAVFDVWCSLLRAQPRAVLWLLKWNLTVQQQLVAEAAARGIAADRLVFAPLISADDHLRRLSCADVFLDTWPCNAHTTASEALWVGVPVVTLIGQTFAQRVAASLLEAVELPQWVTHSPAEYEAQVTSLMNDAQAREGLRTHLQAQCAQSPLFDGQRFARDLEALLGRMWERKKQGLAADFLPAVVDAVESATDCFERSANLS